MIAAEVIQTVLSYMKPSGSNFEFYFKKSYISILGAVFVSITKLQRLALGVLAVLSALS